MSEETNNTQEVQPVKEDDTQPLKPVKQAPRWQSILLTILGVLILLALGTYSGFWRGEKDRQAAQTSLIDQQLTQQYQFALVDEQFGRYDAARQRLEFISKTIRATRARKMSWPKYWCN